ncbi:hypothetical protein BLNAU_5397 [Blattamonas nauphoetae]|uniref:non-specific serine/threonine protein kinase n=1 Tax=Blattamonas nauphoetae TaxID=2049346 RepID=A0ABQ9Y7H2_9EUKA|nr:hypothetical protein BLNAU_5397 [Blattamonas nauphoetae]
MDVSPEAPSANVSPVIRKNITGGDIVLCEDIVIPGSQLEFYKGQDIITTDGKTLLGADDKADGLVRHINDGGFGTVIEVSENTTGEHFAVKMMRCMSRKDEERIGREVQRLRTFGHPNIVGLKEVVKMENMQAIVMELGGQSLAQVVKSHSERGVLIDRHVQGL